MKRLTTKILTIAACATMLFTTALTNTQSVQAATKAQGTVNLATKKLVIKNGSKTSMKSNTLTMVKNRKYQVKAKFGSKTVTKKGTYTSSKPAVALVSSTGLVTAKNPGTTTIKIKYKGKTQSFKIKVVASHTHSWKTTKKATCETTGKKLCKTCGVTQSVAKTAHHYKTVTSDHTEGRGKTKTYEEARYCSSCNIDVSDWTLEQREAHQSHFDAMKAGILSYDCWSAGTYGYVGEVRYEKYMRVRATETYCEDCGAWDMKNTYETDLYLCDANGRKLPDGVTSPWELTTYEYYLKSHGFVNCPFCHDMEVIPGNTCQVCKQLVPAETEDNATAARAAIAPQDTTIEEETNETPVDTEIVTESVVSDNEITDETVSEIIVSDNELN